VTGRTARVAEVVASEEVASDAAAATCQGRAGTAKHRADGSHNGVVLKVSRLGNAPA
jgi:hypothetical protein